MRLSRTRLALLVTIALVTGVCALQGSAQPCGSASDKIALWRAGDLRGANLWQGRWGGSSNPHPGHPIGNIVGQTDLNDLRFLGANYVQLSVAGLYTEQPPYVIDGDVQQVIDNVVDYASRAGLYVAIAFRSGPGRNEQAISRSTDATTYGPINEVFWTDNTAQQAWLRMLRDAAVRYGANPAVIGIDPLVEPNAFARHGFDPPQEFYSESRNSLEDINQFYTRATAIIRSASEVPILLEGDGYGSVDYLPYLSVTGDSRTVYTVHYYEPTDYTHQAPNADVGYPDAISIPGIPDLPFDKRALERSLRPLRTFKQDYGVPIAVTEFGMHRYSRNAEAYLSDVLNIFEDIGAAHAVWEFVVSAQRPVFNDFDIQGSPDPHTKTKVATSAVQSVLRSNFAKSCVSFIAT